MDWQIETDTDPDLKVEQYLAELPITDRLTHQASAQALVEGSLLGLYRFQAYKTDLAPGDQHEIADLTIMSQREDGAIQDGANLGTVIARRRTGARPRQRPGQCHLAGEAGRSRPASPANARMST